MEHGESARYGANLVATCRLGRLRFEVPFGHALHGRGEPGERGRDPMTEPCSEEACPDDGEADRPTHLRRGCGTRYLEGRLRCLVAVIGQLLQLVQLRAQAVVGGRPLGDGGVEGLGPGHIVFKASPVRVDELSDLRLRAVADVSSCETAV